MSRLSDSRISHLAHLIIDGIRQDRLAEIANEGHALNETKRTLSDFFQREDDFDDIVRRKIESLSRRVPPGSREWDVLYRKYLEEERRRQKR